ncbi:MAG: rhomboid family intramembrane serine protease [Micromonosporaceae bacterium]|nr:rhomboid family intramembrane serine protease [Micromonosporaceae bacterium]
MREASVGFQCPECVAQGRRTQRPARTAFGGGPLGERGYVTITLIAVNVIMLLASLASARNAGGALAGQGFGGLLGGITPLMQRLGVQGQAQLNDGQVIPYGIANGEYYRLFTAMFMHYGALHILMNMWALWVLGRTLEMALGPVRFLALYLVAGLGGNVAAYLWQPGALSAGASTALFGLFAALVIVLRRMRRDISTVIPVIVLNLIITISVPGISIAGHLGGFVTGGLVGAGIAYAPRANRTLVQVLAVVGMLAVLVVLTLTKTAALRG